MDTEARLVETEQRSKSNTHRIDRLETRIDEQDRLLQAIYGLQKDIEHTKSDVSEIKVSLRRVIEKPGKRWETVVTTVVTALVSALLGAAAGRLWG